MLIELHVLDNIWVFENDEWKLSCFVQDPYKDWLVCNDEQKCSNERLHQTFCVNSEKASSSILSQLSLLWRTFSS